MTVKEIENAPNAGAQAVLMELLHSEVAHAVGIGELNSPILSLIGCPSSNEDLVA